MPIHQLLAGPYQHGELFAVWIWQARLSALEGIGQTGMVTSPANAPGPAAMSQATGPTKAARPIASRCRTAIPRPGVNRRCCGRA